MNKIVFKALTLKETGCQNVEECILMFNHIETEKIAQLFKGRMTLAMVNNIHKSTLKIKISIPYYLLIGATFLILMIFNVKCDKSAN